MTYRLMILLGLICCRGIAAEPGCAADNDHKIIKEIMGTLSRLVEFSPEPDRAISIGASFRINDNIRGRLLAAGNAELLRGSGRRFRIAVDAQRMPGNIRRLVMGIGEHPWMVSAQGTVYHGTGESFPPENELRPDARIFFYQRTGAGLLNAMSQGITLPPEWCTVELKRCDAGKCRISVRTGNKMRLDLYLQADEKTPEKLIFSTRQLSGELVFSRWLLDAPPEPEAFAPPSGSDNRTIEVGGAELRRMFAAVLNFLIEGE